MGRYKTTAADVSGSLGTLSGWRLGLCLGVLALCVIAIAAIDFKNSESTDKPSTLQGETATLVLQFPAGSSPEQLQQLAQKFDLKISSSNPGSGQYLVEGQLDERMLAAFLNLPNLLDIGTLPRSPNGISASAQQGISSAQ